MGNLKRVILENNELIVSNYIDTIHVPLGNIVSIRQDSVFSNSVVFVKLNGKTNLGDTIVFMPKMQSSNFKKNELVALLCNCWKQELMNSSR